MNIKNILYIKQLYLQYILIYYNIFRVYFNISSNKKDINSK